MHQSIYLSLFLSAEKVVPCNDTVACASGTTCCKTDEGTWACCPLPEVFNTVEKLSASFQNQHWSVIMA